MNGRRELTGAVLGSVLAGALALASGGQPWARVTITRPLPLPPLTAVQSAPLVPAAGLVLLAGGLALIALRGAGRVAVGLLMAAAGGLLGWSGLRGLTGGLAGGSAHLPGIGGQGHSTVHVSAAWPVLAIVAGVLGIAAGLLVVLRSRGWPGMGRRYEREGAATASAPPVRTDEERAQAAWRALDRGEDPTDVADV